LFIETNDIYREETVDLKSDAMLSWLCDDVYVLINIRENRRATRKGQSRDTSNMGHNTQNKDKQSKKTITKN